MNGNSMVLVTGGSGFIAAHCILQLIAQGYGVRTTVRHRGRESTVRAMLKAGGVDAEGRVAFVEADLERDAGWPEAVAGCEYVLHVASPFPARLPSREEDLIRPAKEGTLRVLRAARHAHVRRVVVTSSFAAIGYGHPHRDTPFDETSWTDPNGTDVRPYVKSKTLAERAAWDFVARDGGGLELAVVNPVGVFGPILGPDYSTSIVVIERMLRGTLPGCPRLRYGVVDVRDVADLHLRAMTHRNANGERFLAVAGDFLWIREMAQILTRRLGPDARKVSTRELPNWLVRGAALLDPAVKQVLPDLGRSKNGTSEKARRLLGWSPRSNEEALVASGESLYRLGVIKR